MVFSFFRKFASAAKAKRPVGKPVSLWVRPSIEALDQRVLPSVNATLKGGVLKVIANPHQGTSEVEIIQSPTQIMVEDTGQLVNSFDLSQVQRIDFKFREGQHQHTKFALDIPVNQQQMIVAGLAVSEVDLSLGAGTLIAGVNTTLPDGTPLSLSGPVDNQGNYDLTGTADITVDGFALPGASFEFTPTSAAVSATLAIGSDTVNLAGMLDNQGNYDLTGAANVTVAGFPLNASFELTNTSLTVAAPLILGSNTIYLSGTVDNAGIYHLAGTSPITIAGFRGDANFSLTNSGLTVSANINVIVATVNFSGTVDNAGTYHLTGTANVGLAGFPVAAANFSLTNSGLTLSANINVFVATVAFSGTVDDHGNFRLTGTANVSLASFPVAPANFSLTNTGLTLSANINVFVARVNFSGTVDNHGNFQLTANARMAFAGFGASGSLLLRNSGLTMSGILDLSVMGHRMNLNGSIAPNGTFSLTDSVTRTFGPITFTLQLTLTNRGFTAHVHAVDDVSTVIQGTTVAYRGSFDTSFTIATNGTYNASSTFTMTAYQGATGSSTIGFSINSHQFVVRNSQIAVMFRGMTYHPFGDAVDNY